MHLAIFLPTFKRPNSLQRVSDNIHSTTAAAHTLYFGLEASDEQGIKAAKATGDKVVINKYEPGYSNTIQTIYETSSEPFFIHANDDFLFLPHWDEIPLKMFDRPDLMVVGLRQTEGDTHGSAISMVRRSYIETMSGVIDMPNRVFYPYNHNYVDTEFTRTAQSRGVWAKCDELGIIHQHPLLVGSTVKDETYLKNEATVDIDKQTFNSRQTLFGW